MRRSHPLRAALWPLAILASASALAQPPHPRGPPAEAVQACASKNRGEACTVTLREHEVQGTCDSPPDQTTLACRPPHPRGPPPEALEACQGQQAGAACTVTLRDQSLQGQCRTTPDHQTACLPEGMPPPPP